MVAGATPEEYRRQAAHIRAAAVQAVVPEIKAELLEIAAAFERLAERARKSRASD